MEALFLFLTALFFTAIAAKADLSLTFEDRVKAQEAIERVYYEHRIWPKENPGPKPPFEQMVTKAQLEAKVTDYLKKSAALDTFWQRPITAEQLQAEMDRMAKGTKDPATLKELFAALGNDPYLIAECLAGPVLADRLIRNWYANDERFHGETRQPAEEALEAWTTGNFCAPEGAQYHKVVYRLENEFESGETRPDGMGGGIIYLSPQNFEKRWKESPAEGELSGIQQTTEAFVIQHTLQKYEGGIELESLTYPKKSVETWLESQAGSFKLTEEARTESAYSLPTIPELSCVDGWDNGILDDMPDARYGHSAVWTGSEMIVWGGHGSGYLSTGWRYSPSTDSWTQTSMGTNPPAERSDHSAVWMGSEMIVWGGNNSTSPYYTNTGGRYNPSEDSWIPTSMGANVPVKRYEHTAIWTGSEMIVWGGYGTSPSYKNDGGRYNPATDSWLPTSIGANAPVGRTEHTAVWTGSEMIVWGGDGDSYSYLNTGGRYNPLTDSWIPTSTGANVPMGRDGHTVVWTGNEMIVWGGHYYDGSSHILHTGGRYDPSTDSWIPTSTGADVPLGRVGHTAIWTDYEMIIWGGYYCNKSCDLLSSGGRYDPSTDLWIATSTGANVPSGRISHTAVWTGSEMIVWGGADFSYHCLNTGYRYDPSTDSWLPTSAGAHVPFARSSHTAVWTGAEMIVWGGYCDSSGYLNTGGRYDPATDSWLPTSMGDNVPIWRFEHTAIWTGLEMIVWGGYYYHTSPQYPIAGGRYDPSTNSWIPTSTGTDVPMGRNEHTVVWTGSEMIVWGGYKSTSPYYTNTGGRYNPSEDSWLPTSTGANVPLGRDYHTAIWTGSEMIVWGGNCNSFPYNLNTGGRYNPSTDSWIPTSIGTNVPSARVGHTAVWTGDEMIIWGGYGSGFLKTGGRYNPLTDSWIPTTTESFSPSGRVDHSAVWTGLEMIVWGGYYSYNWDPYYLNSGGRYNPLTDSWTPIFLKDYVPSARHDHTAVWTGAEMIVWGGYNGHSCLNSGGIYMPYGHPSPPLISGDSSNTCPAVSVTLFSTGGIYVSYQWYWNGIAIPGATASTYGADISGNYRVVGMTYNKSCWGMSDEKAVTIAFCATPEVSPQGCAVPLRIVSDPASATGFYLHFEKIPYAAGYNIYEGDTGDWYSHADSLGKVCNAAVADLGTGEMRAEPAMSVGDHYYLVTAFAGGAEGPSGFDSAGTEIPKSQSTCSP